MYMMKLDETPANGKNEAVALETNNGRLGMRNVAQTDATDDDDDGGFSNSANHTPKKRTTKPIVQENRIVRNEPLTNINQEPENQADDEESKYSNT